MLWLWIALAFGAGFALGCVLAWTPAYRDGVQDAHRYMREVVYRDGWHDGLRYAADQLGDTFPVLRPIPGPSDN